MTLAEKLKDALSHVTIDLINTMSYGDEIRLNSRFVLYHYTEEDVIVLNCILKWEEVYQVMVDGDEITYEELLPPYSSYYETE